MSRSPRPASAASIWRWLAVSRAAIRAALGTALAPIRERLAPAPRPVPSGLYRTTTTHRAIAFADSRRRAGHSVYTVDLDRVTTKAGFLAEMARRLPFPDYFGHNWDALDECLRDLAYLPGPGYLILISHADRFASADPANWRTVLAILAHAAAEPPPPARTLVVVLIDPAGVANATLPLPMD